MDSLEYFETMIFKAVTFQIDDLWCSIGDCENPVFPVYSFVAKTIIIPRCEKCRMNLCGQHLVKQDIRNSYDTLLKIETRCPGCQNLLWVMDLENERQRRERRMQKYSAFY